MSDRPPAGVVVDTMVISWLFDEQPNPLADRYRELIGDTPVVLAFQTVMELRFGALRAGWSELRRRGLDRRIARLSILQPDDDMITRCAQLRADCQRIGHALADKVHDGDRWIASAALRLNCPLVSHDKLFKNTPGLTLITANEE
jgi:predicted nucleic acid-binding protein